MLKYIKYAFKKIIWLSLSSGSRVWLEEFSKIVGLFACYVKCYPDCGDKDVHPIVIALI